MTESFKAALCYLPGEAHLWKSCHLYLDHIIEKQLQGRKKEKAVEFKCHCLSSKQQTDLKKNQQN